MNSTPRSVFKALYVAIASWVVFGVATSAQAQQRSEPPLVTYDPTITQIQGQIPFSRSYVMNVTSPATVTSATTVSFAATVDAKPSSVTDGVALSYLSYNPTQLTFTQADQTLPVTVTLNVPGSAALGSYGYQIIAHGFPEDAELGLNNFGSSINATVTAAEMPPQVAIETPFDGEVFKLAPGETLPKAIAFRFTGSANTSYPITSISAVLDQTTPIELTSVSGIGTGIATGQATLSISSLGAHTVTARAVNSVGSAEDIHLFRVEPQGPVISPNPDPNCHAMPDSGPLAVPVGFSVASFGAVAQVTATLNGVAFDLSATGIGSGAVQARGSVSIANPGTFVLELSATDQYGTQRVSRTLTAERCPRRGISGAAFFDVNRNGLFSALEPGLPIIWVSLRNAAGTEIARTSTNVSGYYTFAPQPAGEYDVHVEPYIEYVTSLVLSTPKKQRVVIECTACCADVTTDHISVPPFAHVIDLDKLRDVAVSGSKSAEYWTKALGDALVAISTTGPLYSDSLGTNTKAIRALALSPYENLTVESAFATLSAVAASPIDVLKQQVLAAEYNFAHGAFIGGSQQLTMLLIWWGEYILSNPSQYSNNYVLWARDWFLAYNNAGAGILTGPVLPPEQYPTSGVINVLSPPTVTIDTPPAGQNYDIALNGPKPTIPLSFTATSHGANGAITTLRAMLNGKALAITTSNLGTAKATGTCTLTLDTVGTHNVVVEATDQYGTALGSRSFMVTQSAGRRIAGEVFFDIYSYGTMDPLEPGLAAVWVRLKNSANEVVARVATNLSGYYRFENIPSGTYTVSAESVYGLILTCPPNQTVTVSCPCDGGPVHDVFAKPLGYTLDFGVLGRLTAAGTQTAEYWKSRLNSTITTTTTTVLGSVPSVTSCTNTISALALAPFDQLTNQVALTTLASTSTNPVDQLSRELLAAEYNYASAAHLGADSRLTFLFIWWGEYIASNPTKYTPAQIQFAKDWFAAYNNSKGGLVSGPTP